MKNLKAFTLLELLFVMILTTIIIGIGYFAFTLSVKQLHAYKENSEKITGAFQLTMLLNRDFAEARSVLKINDTLLFTNTLNNRLEYFFSENYILRNINSTVDTFFYSTQNMSEKFLDAPVITNNGLVDEIYFEIKSDKDRIEIFHATKSYSAEALIQNENLKLNKSL